MVCHVVGAQDPVGEFATARSRAISSRAQNTHRAQNIPGSKSGFMNAALNTAGLQLAPPRTTNMDVDERPPPPATRRPSAPS